MSKEARMTKPECASLIDRGVFRHSDFVIPSTFVIGLSSFVIPARLSPTETTFQELTWIKADWPREPYYSGSLPVGYGHRQG
jgi:hypothetical protein